MKAPYFRNNHVAHPKARAATAPLPPAFTHDHEGMKELRTPHERLAMVSTEALRQRAAKTHKVALADHVRRERRALIETLARQAPSGDSSLPHSDSPASPVPW